MARDATFYDLRGRVAHESVFNLNNGDYRCPNSQQGFAPFTTWTRGLAWIMCGYPEELLEFLATLDDAELAPFGGRAELETLMLKDRARRVRFLHRAHAHGRHPVLGHRCAGPVAVGQLPRPTRRMYLTTGNPWTAARRPSRRRDLLRLGHYLQGKGEAADGRALFPGGSDRSEHPLRRTLSQHRPESPGPDPALDLPSPERLGPHPAGIENPVRRSEPVGRLPCPRGRSLRAASGGGTNPYYTFFG